MSIRGMNVKLGADTTALTAAIRDVSQESYKLYGELRKVHQQLRFDPHHVDLLAQRQAILTDQVDETRKKLDTLREAQKSVNEQYERGEIPVEKYRAFERELIKTESQLRNYEKQLKEATAAAVPFNAKMQELSEKVKSVGQKASEVGGSLTKTLSVPLLGIATVAAKVGMDFEESMLKVKAYSGASADEMAKLEKAARDAGATTSKSASDAADALGYMALAGWDVKDSVDGLMPVLRLSEAGNIDLAKASSLVTDSMSALGLTTKELPEYLDAVAQTARSSNTNIDQMTEAYIRVGGTLRGLNVPINESAVALGMLANAGIKGGEAGTALNAVLLNLTAPVGRAKEALDGLNYSAFDSEGNFKGLEQVLFDVRDMTAGMTEEQRNLTLSMIGGKNHTKDLNALLNGLGDSYADLKQAVAESDDALDEMAKTMMDNARGSLIELKSALEELALKVYDVIQPAIKGLIDGIKTFVQWLDNLSPAVQRTIVVVGGIVAAIGPALAIFGKLTSGVGSAISMFGKLAGFVQATLIPAITSISAPVAATVAGIAALAIIAYEVYRAWDEVKVALSATWEYLKAQAENLGISVSIAMENMKAATLSAVDFMLEKLSVLEKIPFGVGEKFAGLKDSVADSVEGSAEKLDELHRRAAENADRIADATEKTKVAFSDLGAKVKEDIDAVIGAISGKKVTAAEIVDPDIEVDLEETIGVIQKAQSELTAVVKAAEVERTEVIEEETDKQREARERYEEDWNKKLFNLQADRLEKLEAEYAAAIEMAEELGANKAAIEEYYRIMRENYEEEDREKRIAFEEDYAAKLLQITTEGTKSRLEVWEEERAEVLRLAEELGADTLAVRQYFAELKSQIIEEELEAEQELYRAQAAMLTDWEERLALAQADKEERLELEAERELAIIEARMKEELEKAGENEEAITAIKGYWALERLKVEENLAGALKAIADEQEKEEEDRQKEADERVKADAERLEKWQEILFEAYASEAELLKKNAADKIAALEAEMAEELAAIEGNEELKTEIRQYYADEIKRINEELNTALVAEDTKAMQERESFEKEWAKKLAAQSEKEVTDKLELLKLEKAEVLKIAKELGADTAKIKQFYANEELKIINERAKKAEAERKKEHKAVRDAAKKRNEERTKFEVDWNKRLFTLTADRVKTLEKERDEQIKIAEELGAETHAVRKYYEELITEEHRKQVEEREKAAKKEQETLERTVGTWVDSYAQIVRSVADGSKSMREAFKDVLITLVEMLQREVQVMQIAELAKAIARGWLDWTAIARAAAAIAASTAAFEGAKAVIRGLATGGVVKGGSDQVFRLGDGREDEAVLPLSPAVYRQLAEGITSQMATHNKTSNITQNVTIQSPRALSPAEIARKNKQQLKNLALEWGI